MLASIGASVATVAVSQKAGAQSFAFRPNQRYPDPAVEILDPSFAKYRLYSSTLEQVATGMRWAEGPVYFPEGGYLLCSDIPNNWIMKYSEKDGSFTCSEVRQIMRTATRATGRAGWSPASIR